MAQTLNTAQLSYLARMARGKLLNEAQQIDHNLRLVVIHANLLDSLMVHLAFAQQREYLYPLEAPSYEQGANLWRRHHQHPFSEEEEEEEEDEECDSDAEYADSTDDEVEYQQMATVSISSEPTDRENDYDQMEDLVLARTTWRHSPPELVINDDSGTDEEFGPPTPTVRDIVLETDHLRKQSNANSCSVTGKSVRRTIVTQVGVPYVN